MTRAAWIVAGATAFVLAIVYAFRGVFGPLLAALALAYALEPVTARLSQRMPRAFAVVLVFAVASTLAVGLGFVLVLQGLQLVAQFSAEDGAFVQGVEYLVDTIDRQIDRLPAPARRVADRSFDEEVWQSLLGRGASLAAGVLETVLSSVNTLSVIVLTPFYLFYLMLDLPRIWNWTVRHLPLRDRERSLRTLSRIHSGLSAFLRGRLVLALVRGSITAVGLGIVGTPQWLAVGLGSGFLSIVPFLGPVLGWAIAAVLTLSARGVPMTLVVTGLFLFVEWLENLLLMPWVMRQGADLHPLTVLFCVVFWSAAFGVFGALVAIPLTIVLRVVAREYVMPALEQVSGTAPPPAITAEDRAADGGAGRDSGPPGARPADRER